MSARNVGVDSLVGQIGGGVANSSPSLRCIFEAVLLMHLLAEIEPATPYTLRRKAVMMKISFLSQCMIEGL